MRNEYPQPNDENTEQMRQEVARQQIAAEQAQENARFLASENNTLRSRVYDGSANFMHMLGFLMVIGAIVAAFLFLTSSSNDARQQAEVSRQQAEVSRMESNAARTKANAALDAAYRAGQRSQAASATAQQAASTAARAEQTAQQPAVIVNPPPQPIIVTPPEPPMTTETVVTEIPSNAPATPSSSDDEKPLEGRIE